MTVYKCSFYEIRKYSQLRAIVVFMIESVSGCFLICYINTTLAIAAKLKNVRARNQCFAYSIFYLSDYVTFSHYICLSHYSYSQILLLEGRQTCCYTTCSKWSFKNNGNQYNPSTFSDLLSILAFAFSLTALFLWSKFHLQKVYSSMVSSSTFF